VFFEGRNLARKNYSICKNINISFSFYSVRLRPSGEKGAHTGWNKPFSFCFIPSYLYQYQTSYMQFGAVSRGAACG